MKLYLRLSGSLEDWYVLEGGHNWAQVEGTSEHWMAIAKWLRGDPDGDPYHKRCAVSEHGGCLRFWSPRNAYSERDYVLVPLDAREALAVHIETALGLPGVPGVEVADP